MSPELKARHDPLASRLAFAAALVVVTTLAMVGAALVMRWVAG